jgi:hypothetical protein
MNGYNYMNENVYIGEVIGPDCESVNNKLTVTSKATVQPVALMRCNFVPSSRPARGTRTSIVRPLFSRIWNSQGGRGTTIFV